MRWRKLGLVRGVQNASALHHSHRMLPTPWRSSRNGGLRVFYTACDSTGAGRPFYADLDPTDPTRVVCVSEQPLMDVGLPGTFDENGAVPTSIVGLPDGRLMMYYVGFELGTRIRYRLLTGLAISEDDGETFRRHSPTPILERSRTELYFRCGPYVLRQPEVFRMWYIAGSRWIDVAGKAMPEYSVHYLESTDGMTWAPSGRLVMEVTHEDEHGFGRPWVIRTPRGYEMYYSIRRKSLGAYRMGYAESADGVAWTRKDSELGLDAGPDHYDNQAIMYAAPIAIDGRVYCFYNGNDFGRDGFAVAIREDA